MRVTNLQNYIMKLIKTLNLAILALLLFLPNAQAANYELEVTNAPWWAASLDNDTSIGSPTYSTTYVETELLTAPGDPVAGMRGDSFTWNITLRVTEKSYDNVQLDNLMDTEVHYYTAALHVYWYAGLATQWYMVDTTSSFLSYFLPFEWGTQDPGTIIEPQLRIDFNISNTLFGDGRVIANVFLEKDGIQSTMQVGMWFRVNAVEVIEE